MTSEPTGHPAWCDSGRCNIAGTVPPDEQRLEHRGDIAATRVDGVTTQVWLTQQPGAVPEVVVLIAWPGGGVSGAVPVPVAERFGRALIERCAESRHSDSL